MGERFNRQRRSRISVFLVVVAFVVGLLAVEGGYTASASAASTPGVSVPRLVASYTGTEDNLTFKKSATLALSDVTETQNGAFTGVQTLGPQLEPPSVDVSGAVSGDTINFVSSPFTNIICKTGGCVLTYTGTISAQGTLSGTYTATNTDLTPAEQHGTWQLSPVCPGVANHALDGATGIAAVNIGGCPGYFVTDSAGQVAAFGAAIWHGDPSGARLNAPVIAITATSDGEGYWLLGADGGVFNYGDANFYGSTGSMRLNAPVVGMAVTADSKGYWIIAKDGGVFTFGDAVFHGSTGSLKLNAPVVGIAVAPGGNGYWLVASDGGVFTFTTDGFYGSHGASPLNKPVIGMSSTPNGKGYTLVASDGGVFTYGDAPFYGSLGSTPAPTPVVDLSPAPADNGYYLVDSGGDVYAFGPGATYLGGA